MVWIVPSISHIPGSVSYTEELVLKCNSAEWFVYVAGFLVRSFLKQDVS